MFFDFVSRLHLSFINPFLRKINSCGTRLAPPIFTRRLFALVSAVIFISVPAFAFGGGSPVLPTGGSFAAGGGTISSSGPSMTINQTTSKGIINWQGFSIGKGGSVLFNNGAGATLNRVTGSSMSSIAGLLKATGSLYLINPNGIVITPTGSVITGGDFIASTLNISDSDFLNGNLSFYGTTGSVTNNGSIVSSGSAVLVGTFTTNNGTVSSSGTASLASGTRLVLIPENGPSGILISPSSLPGNVTNSGVIKAASVYLSSSNGDVYALAGNNGGLIEATGTKTINGQVWLTAPSGTISVNSPIIASNSDGSGGTILIDGLNNLINSNSILNASGTGGVIKVGLFPSLPESLSTTLSSGVTLLAGGVNTKGFIDTSGDNLNIGSITVNANGGEWLLDPSDFTIDSTAATTIDNALGSSGSGTNVTLTTTSTSASSNPSGIGTASSGTGDINIDAPISWGSTASLTLSAYNNINLNSNITVSGNGTLALYYNTGNLTTPGTLNFPWAAGGDFAGSIQFTGTSSGNLTGTLNINGTGYMLINANNLSSIGSAGDYALATDITAPSSFTPIGESIPFTGDFNGLGNTISNLTINDSSDGDLGLFGQIGVGGVVENLGLINESIADSSYNLGFITDNGGIVGYNNGAILNSYSTGSVSGTNNDGSMNGGIVGWNYYGTISDSYSTDSVSGYNSSNNGGIAGYNYYGTIADSYSTGSVSGSNSGNDHGSNDNGGIAGDNIGTISDSYSMDSVSGSGGGINGGIVGWNYGTISDSYSTGSVSGIGIGAENGGIAGYNGVAITDSYWDTDTSGKSSGVGYGTSGGTGLTDAQMKQSYSFTGFDFKNVWVQDNGYTYPLLRVFIPPLVQKIIPVVGSAISSTTSYYPLLARSSNTPNSKDITKCHCTLSPKQSRKIDKEIVKIGGKVTKKVVGKIVNKILEEEGIYPPLIFKPNSGGPT